MHADYVSANDDTEPIDPDVTAKFLDYLEQHLTAYPFNRQIDARFVEELLRDFPDLNILEELKAFRWYYEDSPISRVKKPRVALRRWMANARPRDRW